MARIAALAPELSEADLRVLLALAPAAIEKEQFSTPRSPAATAPGRHAHQRQVAYLLAPLDSGLYVPNRSSMFCSRSSCPFWQACEDEYGGQVRDGHGEEVVA